MANSTMYGYVSIVKKELIHIIRDPATLVIALLIPMFQLTIFGFAVNFDIRHIETVVVDQDRSRESRQYIERIKATDYLEVTTQASSPDEAASLIRSGQARVAVIIPSGFARKSGAAENPEVAVLIDGSDSQVAIRARQAFFSPPPNNPAEVKVKTNVLYNPDMRTETFMVPGLIGVILQIVAVSLTSFSLVREREQGTMEQLMVSPVGKLGLMLGKITPYAVLAFIEMLTVLAAGFLVFDVRVVGNVALLLVLSIPFILAALSLGLLISTIATNQAQALQLSILLMMPSILMSGFVFPRATMPGILYLISQVLPVTHFLTILRGIIVRGAGFGEIWPSVQALLIICAVLIFVSAMRFRKTSG